MRAAGLGVAPPGPARAKRRALRFRGRVRRCGNGNGALVYARIGMMRGGPTSSNQCPSHTLADRRNSEKEQPMETSAADLIGAARAAVDRDRLQAHLDYFARVDRTSGTA